jgi:hypothetical protein
MEKASDGSFARTTRKTDEGRGRLRQGAIQILGLAQSGYRSQMT